MAFTLEQLFVRMNRRPLGGGRRWGSSGVVGPAFELNLAVDLD